MLIRTVTAILIVLALMSGFWGCSMMGLAGKKVPGTGAEIMDRHVEAIGGLKAYERINNRYTRATMTMENMGITIDLEMFAEKPDKIYLKGTSEQVGEIEKGTDGSVYWEKSTMQGSRILEGDELEQARQEYQFDKFAHWRDYYTDAEFVGIDSVNGKPCYIVILTPKAGKLQEAYFDQATFFMTGLKFELHHQMGVIPGQSFISAFREVDGIWIPHETLVTIMGQKRRIVTSEVKHNIELPADMFAVPEDIRALQSGDE